MDDDRFILKPVAYLWTYRLSLALYAASFGLPYDLGRSDYVPGWGIFWLGMLFCWIPAGFPWWANPLFWLALGYSSQRPTAGAFVMALLAFLLAAAFLLVGWPDTLGPAYWAWAGSMGVLAIGLGVSLQPEGRHHVFIEDEDESPWPRPGAPGDEHLQRPPR